MLKRPLYSCHSTEKLHSVQNPQNFSYEGRIQGVLFIVQLLLRVSSKVKRKERSPLPALGGGSGKASKTTVVLSLNEKGGLDCSLADGT